MAGDTTATVEIWVLVDDMGDSEIGSTEDEVNERWESNICTVGGNRRMVKVTLSIPLPTTQELSAVIPVADPEPARLAVA